MKHIIKVNNIQEAKDNPIRPIVALDDSGVLFAEGAKAISEGFVDFGLPSGTLWSKSLLGATNGDTAESWYGNYYAWGEVEEKAGWDGQGTLVPYDWANYTRHTNGTYFLYSNEKVFIKYIPTNKPEYWAGTGDPDNLTTLESVDDVATVTNSAWRMPTKEDFEELLAGTTNKWVENYNNIEGLNGTVLTKATITRPAFKNITLYSRFYILFGGEITDEQWTEMSRFTLEEINAWFGRTDVCKELFKDSQMTILAEYGVDYGFAVKQTDPTISMFIPAAGFRADSDIVSAGSACHLQSSSLYLGHPDWAIHMRFDSEDFNISINYERCNGFSVCPVC